MILDPKLFGKRVALLLSNGKVHEEGVIAGTCYQGSLIILRDDGTFTSHTMSQCRLLPLNDCGAPYR